MSDDNPTPDAPELKVDDWKAPATQDELNAIVEKRLARERARYADYDDVKAKAAEFDKVQEASKTDIEKATARAEAAESSTSALIRENVALIRFQDPALSSLLTGSTREEIEASAEVLASHINAAPKPTKPASQLKSGATAKDDAGLTGKERAAAALRQLRGSD